MKRIIISVILLLIVTLIFPLAANAATTQETEICNKAKENKKITGAECIIYQRNCVLAIKTEKFASKSEYDNFKLALQQQLVNEYNLDKVLITRSPKAMHTIKKLSAMSQDEREKAIEDFIESEFSPQKPHKPIQPRLYQREL